MVLKRLLTLYTWSTLCWLPYSIRCWVLLEPAPNSWWAWSFARMNQFYIIGMILLWGSWGLYRLAPNRWLWGCLAGVWAIAASFVHSISWQAYWRDAWSWVDWWALAFTYLGLFWIWSGYKNTLEVSS